MNQRHSRKLKMFALLDQSVTALLPGEASSVGLTVIGNTLRFTIGIPRGDEGT